MLSFSLVGWAKIKMVPNNCKVRYKLLLQASNSEPETGAVRVAKKRGRPPKKGDTQQPPSTEFDNDLPSHPVASSQPVPR